MYPCASKVTLYLRPGQRSISGETLISDELVDLGIAAALSIAKERGELQVVLVSNVIMQE
jgi:hypothetical protein